MQNINELRRHSNVSYIKNGDLSTNTLQSTYKASSTNRLDRLNEISSKNQLNGSATKRKTDVIEDFDTLIKQHEQYGLKEFSLETKDEN